MRRRDNGKAVLFHQLLTAAIAPDAYFLCQAPRIWVPSGP